LIVRLRLRSMARLLGHNRTTHLHENEYTFCLDCLMLLRDWWWVHLSNSRQCHLASTSLPDNSSLSFLHKFNAFIGLLPRSWSSDLTIYMLLIDWPANLRWVMLPRSFKSGFPVFSLQIDFGHPSPTGQPADRTGIERWSWRRSSGRCWALYHSTASLSYRQWRESVTWSFLRANFGTDPAPMKAFLIEFSLTSKTKIFVCQKASRAIIRLISKEKLFWNKRVISK
jgi:hypothetical protein